MLKLTNHTNPYKVINNITILMLAHTLQWIWFNCLVRCFSSLCSSLHWTHRKAAAVTLWRSADCCTEENCTLSWILEARREEGEKYKGCKNRNKAWWSAFIFWLIKLGGTHVEYETHNFAITPLKLHVGLALVMNAGFAILTSQCKLIVHWKQQQKKWIFKGN